MFVRVVIANLLLHASKCPECLDPQGLSKDAIILELILPSLTLHHAPVEQQAPNKKHNVEKQQVMLDVIKTKEMRHVRI